MGGELERWRGILRSTGLVEAEFAWVVTAETGETRQRSLELRRAGPVGPQRPPRRGQRTEPPGGSQAIRPVRAARITPQGFVVFRAARRGPCDRAGPAQPPTPQGFGCTQPALGAQSRQAAPRIGPAQRTYRASSVHWSTATGFPARTVSPRRVSRTRPQAQAQSLLQRSP